MFYFGFVILLFICLLLYLVYDKCIYTYWKKRNVVFPKPKLIFGNIWEVITLRKTFGGFVQNLYGAYENHPYVGFFVMSKPALLIRDAHLIKDILVKDFEHFQDNWYTVYPEVDSLLACSPFVQKGKKWKETRAFLTSQFTSAKVKSMFPVVKSVCSNMISYIDQLQEKDGTNCLEVIDLSARFTGENVMSCGYGLEANSFVEKSPVTFILPGLVSDPLCISIRVKRTVGLLFSWVQNIIKVTFAGNPTPPLFKNIIKNAVDARNESNICRKDLLDHLIQLNNKNFFDLSDLPGHAYTMYLDGFQTSFSAMGYTLLELALNPEIQEKARNEVCKVLETHSGELSFETIQKLQYLENVLYETLRKHPIIKFMARLCTKEYVLQERLTIEKGTVLFISVRGVHYESQYYSEPDKFDPNRFNEESKTNRPSCAYLGFGGGPRICIGRRFAIAQVLAGLATILSRYDLKINKKTKFPIQEDHFHISDVPISGLYIDFLKRSSK